MRIMNQVANHTFCKTVRNLVVEMSEVRYTQFDINDEVQFSTIKKLIDEDLSEPYSIYVYRFFLNQWPNLTFMAWVDGVDKPVGCIVCKSELHKGVRLRGYIGMLAVEKHYRGRGIAVSYTHLDVYKRQIQKDILGKPIIMISPGVGLAPMKCLIQSNLFEDLYLFFGNRIKEKDFLYGETLTKWHIDGRIHLFSCFSRDPHNSPDAKYVQDLMWKQSQLIANLILQKSAVIYICGSSGKMPVQVRLTVVEILKKYGNFEKNEDAEHYLKEMERTDRYMPVSYTHLDVYKRQHIHL